MEESLEAMLFADELIHFIVNKIAGINYSLDVPGLDVLQERVTSHFHHEIGIAIGSLIVRNVKDVFNCAEEIIEESFLKRRKYYTKLALHAVPFYFPDGYTPEKFIAYCTMVIGASIHLFTDRETDVLDYASGAVSTTMIGFMLTNEFQERGGFAKLFDVCFQLNRA